MATCRSADQQPLAPLVGLLNAATKREIQRVMADATHYVTPPNGKKEELIQEAADFVRRYGHLADVCKSALKGLKKEYIHMILRQYDPTVSHSKSKKLMIDDFICLNEPKCADVPCLAIVPYIADSGVRKVGFPCQLVDFCKTSRKLPKDKKNG